MEEKKLCGATEPLKTSCSLRKRVYCEVSEKKRKTVNNQMYSTPMLLVASHDPVHRSIDHEHENNFVSVLSEETIININLDTKKWRIAPTFGVCKSGDL